MTKLSIVVLLLCLLSSLFLADLPALAGHGPAPVALHLRRATFDPLQVSPLVAPDLQAAPQSRLLLVQFDTPPDASTRARLQAAGLRPLLYFPDYAFLIRAAGPAPLSAAALPGLRWSGPFQVAYKLPAELDSLLSAPGASTVELHVLAAPDADVDGLTRDLRALGGVMRTSSAGLNGPSLLVRLPATALRAVLARDDVLWIEPSVTPHILNDRARQILGVTAARQQLEWLDGAGQIVAVTDTGLDSQPSLSADFAGRIAASFSSNQMAPPNPADPDDPHRDCTSLDWSDHNGHGTHVSGSVLGSGALSPGGASFAGIAPLARLVVQAVSSGGNSLDCLPDDNSYLSKAYDAGARVQNASWGAQIAGYPELDQSVDTFLWDHKQHLLVVAAGNGGDDGDADGVIDGGSIAAPGSAKNVLTVGATENDRPPAGGGCSFTTPENFCWTRFAFSGVPFASDFVSDNINGMAAFSSRGPTDDGRIKPEIVAPGVNIISARSHDSAASYANTYNADYAYDSGTSMATPLTSGLAALVRQWLAQERRIPAPSAALVKALLLNGAADITPGQYGTGPQREIPAAWPNNVEGWGRATLTDTLGLGGDDRVWLRESDGIQTGATISYTLNISDGQPLRLTLVWTDYPGNPAASKQLVNDLDLELQTPGGAVLHGNASADLPADCRGTANADRCNNVESIRIDVPAPGTYVVRVSGAVVPDGPQPFALAAQARRIIDQAAPATATLQPIVNGGQPALALSWDSLGGATYYQLQESTSADFATVTWTSFTSDTSVTFVEDVGTYYFRVRGCNQGGCGPYGATQSATVTTPPQRMFLPLVGS